MPFNYCTISIPTFFFQSCVQKKALSVAMIALLVLKFVSIVKGSLVCVGQLACLIMPYYFQVLATRLSRAHSQAIQRCVSLIKIYTTRNLYIWVMFVCRLSNPIRLGSFFIQVETLLEVIAIYPIGWLVSLLLGLCSIIPLN